MSHDPIGTLELAATQVELSVTAIGDSNEIELQLRLADEDAALFTVRLGVEQAESLQNQLTAACELLDFAKSLGR